MGHVVVMGRKTLAALPGGRALPGRTNIVLSRDRSLNVPDALVVHSREELLEELEQYDPDDIFIIGGASVYRLMMPYCDTAYITKVDYSYQADTYLTDLDSLPEWELVRESEEQYCFDITYTFRVYQRKERTSFPE